jgi:hypothetical protein
VDIALKALSPAINDPTTAVLAIGQIHRLPRAMGKRLRAMLDNLLATLPAHRRPALEQEARQLAIALEHLYPQPEDLALAGVPDSQGLGGSSGKSLPAGPSPR